jgi:hypothetical protein
MILFYFYDLLFSYKRAYEDEHYITYDKYMKNIIIYIIFLRNLNYIFKNK